MALLTPVLRLALRANERAARLARADGRTLDPPPLVKFFNPRGLATWLATELDADGDTLSGLVDLGFGCPEHGRFSARALAELRLPSGRVIVRDIAFTSQLPLSIWADAARAAGSILWVQQMLRPAAIPSRACLSIPADLEAAKES
jgi:hypothetical protein